MKRLLGRFAAPQVEIPAGFIATPRQVLASYTSEERALLKAAYPYLEDDPDQVERILADSRLGQWDAYALFDGWYPAWTHAQHIAAVLAEMAMERHEYDLAERLLAVGDIEAVDIHLMGRAGEIKRWRARITEDGHDIPADLAAAMRGDEPAETAQGLPAVPEEDTDRIHHFSLPDGTDHTRPDVQAKVEARIKQSLGSSWVVAWPRHRDVLDGIDPIFTAVNTRPSAQVRRWGSAAKPATAEIAAYEGLQAGLGHLVEYSEYRREEVFADLDPETVALRARIAEMLRVRPHDVEIALHRVDDEETGLRRLDQVIITRTPEVSVDPAKRRAVWEHLLHAVPGGSSGWEVIEDAVAGVTRLRYGQPRVLPTLVPMADLLPDDHSPNAWKKIPFGCTPEGEVASIDMGLGPHILLVGPSGTGKTIAMVQIATAALVAGYQVVVVDAAKRGADYKRIRPWVSAWARTYAEAGAVLKAAYDESQRRADIIDAYNEDHWSSLPADVREREGIAPLLVVIDEYQAFNEAEKPPMGLDKESPEYAEVMALNDAKAAVVMATRRLVAEARWAGVYVCLGTQRAPSETIPVTMRDNIHWKIQMASPGKPMTPSTLGLTFPADQVGEAAAVITELDDGKSPGLALIAGEGGSVEGVRVGFAPKPEIPGYLEERDVPKPDAEWEIEIEKPVVPGERITPAKPTWGDKPAKPAPAVIDHGEIALSLNDLDESTEDFSFDEDEPTKPTVARRPVAPPEDIWS